MRFAQLLKNTSFQPEQFEQWVFWPNFSFQKTGFEQLLGLHSSRKLQPHFFVRPKYPMFKMFRLQTRIFKTARNQDFFCWWISPRYPMLEMFKLQVSIFHNLHETRFLSLSSSKVQRTWYVCPPFPPHPYLIIMSEGMHWVAHEGKITVRFENGIEAIQPRVLCTSPCFV